MPKDSESRENSSKIFRKMMTELLEYLSEIDTKKEGKLSFDEFMEMSGTRLIEIPVSGEYTPVFGEDGIQEIDVDGKPKFDVPVGLEIHINKLAGEIDLNFDENSGILCSTVNDIIENTYGPHCTTTSIPVIK